MSNLDHKPDGDGGFEPPSDELLAGEYVLGVLDAEQRSAIQARLQTDSAFARRVTEWERRLGALTERVQPVDVPDHLWPRIQESLGWTSMRRQHRSVWQSVGFWRATTGLAAAAAVAAIVMHIPQVPVSPSRQYVQTGAQPVTTLTHDDGTPGWLASVEGTSGEILLVPIPTLADAQGRVPELWLIPPGKPPHSLGLLSRDRSSTVAVPGNLRKALTAGAILAISLEPPGGAPGGAPTGPIIAKGMIRL